MSDLTKGSSKDGKTITAAAAAATELKSELGIILGNNGICALVAGAFFFLMIALIKALRLLTSPSLLLVALSLTNFPTYWGFLVNFYFGVHLDLDEGYKIRRWCRKKVVAFSVVSPRSRINKVLFLLEKEDEDRFLSKRTTNDGGLTELEWELKIIFQENQFYAALYAALCLSFILVTVSLVEVVSEKILVALLMWFMIWFWILFCASSVNGYFRVHLDFGERDKVGKWLRKKIVACSVILPYQDRSRISKALLLLEKKEDDERQKVEHEQEQEQGQEYSKV